MKTVAILALAISASALTCRATPSRGAASSPSVRCLQQGDVMMPDPLERGRSFADSSERRSFKLAAFGRADVHYVTDDALCTRISTSLGPVPPGPSFQGRPRPLYSDVIVVALGQAGYLVRAPWLGSRAGEFYCSAAIVDAAVKEIAWICS